MGFFSKLFKGPEIDMEKSNANAEKMRLLFNQAVENGADYQLIFAYTEDVSVGMRQIRRSWRFPPYRLSLGAVHLPITAVLKF